MECNMIHGSKTIYCLKVFLILLLSLFCSQYAWSNTLNSEQALKKFSSFDQKFLSTNKDIFGNRIVIPTPIFPKQQQKILLSRLKIKPHVIDKWKIQLSTEIIWVKKGIISEVYLMPNGTLKKSVLYPGHLYVNNPDIIDFAYNQTSKEIIVYTMRIGLGNQLWLRVIKGLPSPNKIVGNMKKYINSKPNLKWKKVFDENRN